MTHEWTTKAEISDKVRRRWVDGTLLRAFASGDNLEPITVSLRGPTVSEIGDDVGAARAWIGALDGGSRGGQFYALEWKSIGGRSLGRNQVPVRAVVSTFAQAWSLLGVHESVRHFEAILTIARRDPAVLRWVVQHPLRALDLHREFATLIAAYRWLAEHQGSDLYLRQIDAEGVDTKFAERHRGVLSALLGVSSSAQGFIEDLGLRGKPALVRFRPAPSLGFPPQLSELGLRAEELAQLSMVPRRVLIAENEITYLSVAVPTDGLVIWGRGFDVIRVGGMPWLADADVVYWGDIDTHGFAILDRLRASLPQARSVLMDRETLLRHLDRSVVEERPARSQLSRLCESEAELFAELVADVYGERVRLEQERIDWRWVVEELARADL